MNHMGLDLRGSGPHVSAGAWGLTLMPVGGHGPTAMFGALRSGVAWSTIKVPLSIAVVRRYDPLSRQLTDLIRRAITESDNAAAEELWSSLGAPATAARDIEGVLASAGDTDTQVPTYPLRPPFSIFGQTQWSLGAAAHFVSRLPCLPGSALVRHDMGSVVPSQRYGLGEIPRTIFKGGWGPDQNGRYLVRQLGVITIPRRGDVAVAIAAEPSTGTYTDGIAMLNTIASWLTAHTTQLPAGRCYSPPGLR